MKNLKKVKHVMSFILVIALVSSLAFGIDFKTFASTSQTVYFDNSVSKWSNVYAYVWGDGKSTKAIKGTKVDTNIYQLTIPEGYKKILFKNTSGTSNWDKQTQNTTIPTDGKNCYKANSSSNKSNGTWYSYTTKTATPAATSTASPNSNALKRQVKVLVLEINPTLTHPTGGKFGNGESTITTDKYLQFDASKSISFLKENMEESSHGNVEFDVVERIYINEFPKYTNGASLTQQDFFEIYPIHTNGYGDWWEGLGTEKFKKFSDNLTFDYDSLIDDYNLVERKNAGDFDMVWVFGNDPIALYEAAMVGKKPFFINGGTYTRNCDNFAILTMTFSRKDGSLEDVGHMAECILTNVFQSGEVYRTKLDGTDLSKLTTWEKFVLCEGNAADGTTVYGVGNVHYSPNSETDYDWGNQTPVKSYWKDFENGNLNNIGSTVSTFTAKTAYQTTKYKYNTYYSDTISHHLWWFSCMPHTEGRDENGYSNNWWDYIFTPDYVNKVSFVEGTDLTMSVGDSKQLSLLLNYYSRNKKELGLKESEAIISLDSSGVLTYENGKITAKKAGTATISAKYDGRVANLKVTVNKPLEIKSATIDLGTTFSYGQTATIHVDATGGNGSYTYSAIAKYDSHVTETIDSIDANGNLKWTPKAASDFYTVYISVMDASGAYASTSINVKVTTPSTNNTLTIYYGGQTWSNAYVHYKTENGNWTSVPGCQMTSTSEVSGYNWKYTIDLSKDNSGYATVCFNNGNGNWDSKNGSNYQINAGTYGVKNGAISNLGNSTTTSTPTTPTPVPPVDNTMFYYNNSKTNWSTVYAYVWADGVSATTYEGTKVATNVYQFNVPKKYTKVLFKNTSGTSNWDKQTDDVLIQSTDGYIFVPNSASNKTSGNWESYGNVTPTPTTPAPDPTTPTPVPIDQSYVTVDFDNSIHKWENVYAYVWNNTEDYKVFSPTFVSGSNHAIFTITGSYKYILFKNTEDGWDKQTADLIMPAYTTSLDDKCFTPYSSGNKTEGTWGKSSALTGIKIMVPSVSTDKDTITVGDTVNFTMTALYESGYYKNSRYLTFTYEDGTKDVVRSSDTTYTIFEKVSEYTHKYTWTPSKTGKVKVTYSVSEYDDHVETSQPIILNVKAASNTVKVYYKNSSWSKAYVHYKVNGSWTSVPGVKMEASDRSDYTWMYTIDLGDTTSATLCFNNGSGSWDSRNGSNYTVGTGIYGISGNNTVKLN